MPKLANIKKLQKERAEVAHSALANYVDLDSNKEYVDSSSNSDESSDENFELNDHNQVNSIIEKAVRGSLKISYFFNNQLSTTDYEEDAEDFQSQEYQDEENLNKELNGNLSEELDEETKKIHSAIEFIDNVMSEETLFKTKEACYTAVIYFYRLLLKGQKKMDAAKAISDVINGRSPSKSLLHDELVSFELATYLHFQKFNIDPIIVKNYFEQTILSQLNIKSQYKKCVYVDGHKHPDVVEYHQTFHQE
ncbi:4453_t:CDS:2, partial [Cetraspora pellucida]